MKWPSVLWRGLVIGVADVIPGVSGGTIALLTGIYERFINALKELTNLPKYFYELITKKKSLQEINAQLDWQFLIPLMIGITSAIALASIIIPPLMNNYPAPTFSFFIALIIAASIGLLRAETQQLSSIIALIIGLAIGISFGLIASTTIQHGPLQLLIAGALAMSAMLLPGISGSAVLLILGQYAFILQAIHNPIENSLVIASFVVGILIGVIIITRIISKLLSYSRLHTISALTGLMLGALIMPLQQALTHIPEQPVLSATLAIVGLVLGALLLLSHNPKVSEKTPHQEQS